MVGPLSRDGRSRAMSDVGSSSSDALTSRALRVRRRDSVRRGVAAIDLLDLPPDLLVHILVLLPSLRDVCQVDCVCRLFYYGTPSFGRHSLVEAALRIRHKAHTGLSVPGSLVREPWWPWGSTKAKLVHDERCRRGAMLVPLVPDTVVNGDIDVRKRIVFFRRAGYARARRIASLLCRASRPPNAQTCAQPAARRPRCADVYVRRAPHLAVPPRPPRRWC